MKDFTFVETETHYKFNGDVECDVCRGTGLYCGFAEHDGGAVVCKSCRGDGYKNIDLQYSKFTGLKDKEGIKRVFETNAGIGIGEDKERDIKLSDFGGVLYEDWKENKQFPKGAEMRTYVCPQWWLQSAGKNKVEWEECKICGLYSACAYFKGKTACWARYDKEVIE